jgi:hypothetical protein
MGPFGNASDKAVAEPCEPHWPMPIDPFARSYAMLVHFADSRSIKAGYR